MYTANDMKEALNKYYCDGIDDWLRDEILPRFLSTGSGNCVVVQDYELSEVGWEEAFWKRSMTMREFRVEDVFYRENIDGSCGYKISL